MNIAHFASAFYPTIGGVQEFVRQLTRHQRHAGDNPLIITNRWPKRLPSSELYNGVPVYRKSFRVPEMNWRQLPGALLLGPPTFCGILKLLREYRCDLVHIQCVSSNAYYALHASRVLRIPVVATLHGELSVDANKLFQSSRFAQRLLHAVLRNADVVAACSAHALGEAEEFYGQPLGARARVIHNGVDLSELSAASPFPHPRPYLLAIGRHVRQKGFDILLRSYASLLESGIRTHDLILAGEGPDRAELERLCRRLHISDRVFFTGSTDRATTAQLFTGCEFFVLSSRLEPLGIVNLEAMAAGKAVLATRVGGVPEIIKHNETGLLVSAEDSSALANGMAELITNATLRRQLAAAGRQTINSFAWESVAQRYGQIYQQCIAVRARQPIQTAEAYG